MALILVESEAVTCPRCGSQDIQRSGFSRHSGERRYRCTRCHRRFQLHYAEPKPKIEIRFPSLEPLFKKGPTVDSLLGIPCFGCEELRRNCNPESCEKLTEYLLKEAEEE